MIWLTWRQFRAQAAVAAAGLIVIAVALAITGVHLAHLSDSSGLATCQAHGNCGTVASTFMTQMKASLTYKTLYDGGAVQVHGGGHAHRAARRTATAGRSPRAT
jgi:hypothetical protein